MAKHGKKYTDATPSVRPRPSCTPPPRPSTWPAAWPRAKFDETVELAARLGVDPRKADQMVRGTVALPSGTGNDVRVAVFAAGDAAAAAREAGADIVGADDLVAQVEGGMLDFDVAIATPDLMPQVGKLGRVPRPPWPDAEPQDRHGHHRRGQGRHRLQGRQGRVPHRPPRQRARADRQGQLRGRRPGRQPPGRARRARAGQARPPPRAATSGGSPSPPPWARASRSTRSACSRSTRTPTPRHPPLDRRRSAATLQGLSPGPGRAPTIEDSARRRHPVPLGA